MVTSLRNFRIDDDTWEAFKQTCAADGTNASKEILAFCRARIEGYRLPSGVETSVETTVPTDIDDRIQAAISSALAAIEDRLTRLESRSTSVDPKSPIEPPVAVTRARARAAGEVPIGEWLTQKEVCDRCDLDYSNFSRGVRKHGSPEGYLAAITGKPWEVVGEGKARRFRLVG